MPTQSATIRAKIAAYLFRLEIDSMLDATDETLVSNHEALHVRALLLQRETRGASAPPVGEGE